MLEIRPARLDDEAALSRIDFATTSTATSITPQPPEPRPFFDPSSRPDDVLVAVHDGAVAGYIRCVHPTPFPSSEHVLYVNGFGVDPDHQNQGIGRALVEAAQERARAKGMRRLTLRVLETNDKARRLYEACGFVTEGIFKGEFHLDGLDVDDRFMAYTIT